MKFVQVEIFSKEFPSGLGLRIKQKETHDYNDDSGADIYGHDADGKHDLN